MIVWLSQYSYEFPLMCIYIQQKEINYILQIHSAILVSYSMTKSYLRIGSRVVSLPRSPSFKLKRSTVPINDVCASYLYLASIWNAWKYSDLPATFLCVLTIATQKWTWPLYRYDTKNTLWGLHEASSLHRTVTFCYLARHRLMHEFLSCKDDRN